MINTYLRFLIHKFARTIDFSMHEMIEEEAFQSSDVFFVKGIQKGLG